MAFFPWKRRRKTGLPLISDHAGVVVGVCCTLGLIAVCVLVSGSLAQFVDITGLLIVLGGTFGASAIQFPMADLRHAYLAMRKVFRSSAGGPRERAQSILALSRSIKSEGLMAAEHYSQRLSHDHFFRLALELVVDGQRPEEIRRILETEMRSAHERAERAVRVFETMGNYAPAMGLVGTLIGLIQMLTNLSNPALVGPAMAVALTTTFYGAVLANMVLLPISGRIRNRYEEDVMVKLLTIEGAASLTQAESAVLLEQRLMSFKSSFNVGVHTKGYAHAVGF